MSRLDIGSLHMTHEIWVKSSCLVEYLTLPSLINIEHNVWQFFFFFGFLEGINYIVRFNQKKFKPPRHNMLFRSTKYFFFFNFPKLFFLIYPLITININVQILFFTHLIMKYLFYIVEMYTFIMYKIISNIKLILYLTRQLIKQHDILYKIVFTYLRLK